MGVAVGSAQTGRFDYLDGIRALAIGAVLSLHWLSWYSPFLHGGSIGVDVFFVLSGFIITTMLWRSRGPGSWAPPGGCSSGAGSIRLYPALLGLVVGAIVLYAVIAVGPARPRRGGASRDLLAARSSPHSGRPGSTAASGFRRCTRSGRRGRWPSSGTSTCSGRWSCSPPGPGRPPGAPGRRQPGRRRTALPRGPAARATSGSTSAPPRASRSCSWAPHSRCGSRPAAHRPARATRPPRSRRGLPWWPSPPSRLFAPAAHSPLYRYVEVPVVVLATVVLIYTGYSNAGGPVHRLLEPPVARPRSGGAATASTSGTSCRCCCSRRPTWVCPGRSSACSRWPRPPC